MYFCLQDKEAVLPKRENAGGPKDWGDKPIAGVLDEYMALYAEHEVSFRVLSSNLYLKWQNDSKLHLCTLVRWTYNLINNQ